MKCSPKYQTLACWGGGADWTSGGGGWYATGLWFAGTTMQPATASGRSDRNRFIGISSSDVTRTVRRRGSWDIHRRPNAPRTTCMLAADVPPPSTRLHGATREPPRASPHAVTAGHRSMYDTDVREPEPRRRVAAEHASVLVDRARAGDEPLVPEDERRGRLDAHPERVVERVEDALLRRASGQRRLEPPDVEAGGARELEEHVPPRHVDAADERRVAQRGAQRGLARGALQPGRDERGERGERRVRRLGREPQVGRRPRRLGLARRLPRRPHEHEPLAYAERARLGSQRKRLEPERREHARDVLERGADAPFRDEAPSRERIFVEDERDGIGCGDARGHGPRIVAARSLPGPGTGARLVGRRARGSHEVASDGAREPRVRVLDRVLHVALRDVDAGRGLERSEERRVGKECRSRWS